MRQRSKGAPGAGTGSPPGRWPAVAVCLLLALAVWVVFGQTRHYEFVNYDDDKFIYENAAITQGLSLKIVARAFTRTYHDWYPLTALSHMVDWQLYGQNAGGHHLTNVLLHAATAILLFLGLCNLTGASWPSAFVAAMFAVHPLRVESVAWVTERKDVLSGLFFMLTLGAYARYAQGRRKESGVRSQESEVRPPTSDLRPLTSMDYWLALFCFALGLLSKTMLVTVPFVLLLLDYWPLRRLELSTLTSQLSTLKRLLLEKIPFLLLSAAACGATLWAQERAIQSVQALSLGARIGNALVSYAVYIRQMFYPSGLAVYYPHPGNQLSVWTVGLAVGVLIVITVGVLRWQRQRPYLLVGWLWYLGMLVPVIGILQVGIHARADRYTYLPQIGLYLMVAWGAADLAAARRWGRVGLRAAAVLVLTGLLVLARGQTRSWRDSVSLWTHTLACTSGNPLAHYNFGLALAHQGKLPEAIFHWEQTLQLQPNTTDAHYSLGVALAQQKQWPEAIPHYERALQLKPDYPEAHYTLGVALAAQGRWPEAIPHYERALQLKPEDAAAHNDLGLALAAQGKGKEAIPHFERALRLNPEDANAHNNLGLALAAQGRLTEAIAHFERALQLKPETANADFNLGKALAQQGQWPAAIQHYERALQLKPEDAEAGCNLAWLLATCPDAGLRNPAAALRLAQRASDLTRSRNPAVLDTLAAAQAAGGDFARAVATAKEALALATTAGKARLAREIESRLVLYQAGQPFYEPPTEGNRNKP